MRKLLSLTIATLLLVPALAQADVVFRDDFKNPGSGWYDNAASAARTNALGLGMYTEDGYQMTPIGSNAVGIIPSPKQAAGGDVSMDAKLFLIANDGKGGAGVACRVKDLKNFYGFMALANGSWIIVRAKGGELTPLARGALPKQLMPDSFDGQVSAQCVGNALKIAIDGVQVGSATDDTFSTGESALLVMGTQGGGTNAAASAFRLESK